MGSAIPMAGLDLTQLPEGVLVMINESGSPIPFYAARHNYESGLNGEGRTLMVRKDLCPAMAWNTGGTDYRSSSIDTWLNNSYKAILDAHVQEAVETTTFRLRTSTTSYSTLSRSCFLLSAAEYGLGYEDGTKLDIASNIAIAQLNGAAAYHWTRTMLNASSVIGVSLDGKGWTIGAAEKYPGVRPAFTLPASTKVSVEPNADGSYTLL